MLGALPMVDVWGLNVYRGTTFGDLWSAWPAASTKPLLISEYGVDSFSTANGAADWATQATEVSQMALEVARHAAASGDGPCLGGVVFEWADEWWKSSGDVAVQDNTASWTAAGGYADLGMQEEHFGLLTLQREPKAAYHAYAAVHTPMALRYWPLPPSPSPSPAGPLSGDPSSTNGLILGLAIGVPVGLLLLLGVLIMVWRRWGRIRVDPQAGASSHDTGLGRRYWPKGPHSKQATV